jgi:chromosome segregation ATPase
MSSTLGRYVPFGAKAAYAESCIAGIEGKRERVQYAASESAVRIQELNCQIASWRRQLDRSVARLRVLVNQSAEVATNTIGREVQRHDDLQWKIAQAQTLHKRLEDTIKSLEEAEGKTSQKVVELRGRLEMAKLDHERNNAQDLAIEAHNGSLAGRRTWTSLGAETIQALEHQERTREEWQRRYGAESMADPDLSKADPLVRANEILAERD